MDIDTATPATAVAATRDTVRPIGEGSCGTPLLSMRSVAIRYEDPTADEATRTNVPAAPDGADLEVGAGEIVLLLGPSGCGKTALSLATNGLIPHAVPADLSGRVIAGGLDTVHHRVPELAAHVGMVFQDPDAQMITATVLDEVCFAPENFRLLIADVQDRAESALRLVGLWKRRNDNPDVLSGGGRQRLAIACAVAMRAPLIVLDEPTANLDPVGVDEVYAALAAIVADGRHGILLIEHNLDACMHLVDRVVVLDSAGRPALSGTVREVIGESAAALTALGVWLPTATLAAIGLRRAGVQLDPLPVTPAELTSALDAQPSLPHPVTQPSSVTYSIDTGSTPTSASTIVDIGNLSVRRGGRSVLQHIDLMIRSGEFLAIVGVNGAGKTTLLRAIAGIGAGHESADRLLVDGIDPRTARSQAVARRIGYVFQNPEHQFVTDTVRAELAHGLLVQRRPAAEVAERVDRMLDRFDLAEFADRHPFLLSGGQKRRLSVATALIVGARVLALDEPTYGQDRERAAALIDLLAELNADGVTVLMVTHDLQLVADHARRVAVLADGRLAACGPTEEVLADPVLDRVGLRPPPLARAMRALRNHPHWRSVTRLSQLPGGAG